MFPDLTNIFASYEKLRSDADALFARVADACPQCVACHIGCSDCCNALFDLSLVEAMYINQAFFKAFPHGPQRSLIMEKASETDRRLTRDKRELFQAEKNGESNKEIMRRASLLRMPCPLLDKNNSCVLYGARPITCRLYGVPIGIGGESHVCGLSAFNKGDSYPTVKIERIQERLNELSRQIGEAVHSRYELDEVYVPLSMALLTSYDDAYLGIGKAGEND